MNEEPAANLVAEPVATPDADGVVNLDAAPEANTPAVGSEAEPDPIEELTKEALGSGDAIPEPEFVEVEVDGKKIKVSPEGKDFLLRQADYTRKTMDLAEQRKTFEAERQQFQQVANHTKEELAAIVQAEQLKSTVAQYEAITPDQWTALEQSNPAEAQRLWREYQTLSGKYGQVSTLLQQHFEQKARSENETIAKSRAEAIEAAAKEIPNFTDTRRQELESLAVNMGIPQDVVSGAISPGEYKILHYADIGKKFIERQRHAAQMKAAQAGTPATKVGGIASGGKSPEEMSMEEYIAARNAGTI